MSDTPQNDDVVIEEDNTAIETNDSVLESDTSNQAQVESEVQVDEVEVANKQADLAYNEVIVRSIIDDMYEQYGIETIRTTCSGNMNRSESKSKGELSVELVNAIAIEKANGKLRGK